MSNGPKVLLVEDSEEDVFFFRRAARLSGIPFEVVVAGDGKKAIELLSDREAASSFDAVFLDLKLPLVSGFDVLKVLRNSETPFTAPIYILSGSSREPDRLKALDLGANDYFVKPIACDILRQILSMPTLV